VTLVDSNVLIDIMTDDPRWYGWSATRIEEAVRRGPIFINDVIYAECSVRFESEESFDAALTFAGVGIKPIQKAALFLAGRAFARYRSVGGSRTNVLPDFFIGAQAATESIPLLTRDTRRYRTYFPTVELITPHPV
jgi:predicted nucleic acid-binding protein